MAQALGPYLLHRRFSANASKDAAVATAAHGVLRNIVSNFDTTMRAALVQSVATQYDTRSTRFRTARPSTRTSMPGTPQLRR